MFHKEFHRVCLINVYNNWHKTEVIIIIIIMFIVSNNINSCTYNQSADQLLNTFKTMEKKQIAYVSFRCVFFIKTKSIKIKQINKIKINK